MLTPEIIFEDQQILVVNKPFGLVVNRSETAPKFTLQDWVEDHCNDFSEYQGEKEHKEFLSRSGIVHRLDRETSGVLVFAKTPQAFKALKAQFKNRQVNKQYLALVHRRVKPEKGHIRLPLGRNPKNRLRYTVRVGGKMAETFYQVKKRYKQKNKDYTFLAVFPKTGRTHQIRVHFKYLRHPLVTDSLYLGEKRYHKDRQWCPRLFLHAASLRIQHPQKNEKVEFSAPLPDSLKRVLEEELS